MKQEQARAAETARARDLERERELQRRHELQQAAERASAPAQQPVPDSARPAPPSPAPAPPQAAAPSGQSAASSIEATLRQYEAAWATQDLIALRRIWQIPTAQVSAVNTTFRDARAIHVSVRVINVSLTSDSRAIVRVRGTNGDHSAAEAIVAPLRRTTSSTWRGTAVPGSSSRKQADEQRWPLPNSKPLQYTLEPNWSLCFASSRMPDEF